MQHCIISKNPYIAIVYDVVDHNGVKVKDIHAYIYGKTLKNFERAITKFKTDINVELGVMLHEAQNKDTDI